MILHDHNNGRYITGCNRPGEAAIRLEILKSKRLKMQSKITFLLLLCALTLNSAPVSAGTLLVTDIKSYPKMAEQLKSLQDQTLELKDQTGKLGKLQHEVERYQKKLEQFYTQTKRISRDFEAIYSDIENGNTGRLSGRMQVFVEELTDIDTNLDGYSVGILTEDYDWQTGYQTKFDIQEQYKKTLRDSRRKQAEVHNAMDELKDFEGEIGKTHNLKESAAVRNSLLLTIVKNTHAMTGLLAKQQELEALSKYTGYSPELRALFKNAREEASREGRVYRDTPADRIRARGGIPTAEMTPFQKRCMLPWGTIKDYCE